MSEEILINGTPGNSRVAIVENGQLQEIWMDRASINGYVGNVYKGVVSRVLPGLQAAFIDIGLERTAFLHASDIYRADSEQCGQPDAIPPIGALVSEGSEIVVQVIKNPIGSKGARLTTNPGIPSRFLVLIPGSDFVGISARIIDQDERERLTDLVRSLRSADENFAYIVRTNAEGVDSFALSADMTFLRKVWQAIQEKTATARPGQCVYQDLSMPLKALRDLMHEQVDKVRIDSAKTYDMALQFVQNFIPQWSQRIEHYDAERPIFDLYGVEDQIQLALHRHTPLKSGGHIVIDQTEAMTTIDVNTGAYTGQHKQEETVYTTNLEAARVIARQLRLRNLGGIIIIDFIDMAEEEHKSQVMTALEDALSKDPARTSISGLSALGLVEMTRKRTTDSLGHILCEPCSVCAGAGSVKSAETVSQEVFREIIRSGKQFESGKLLIMASPVVVNHILDEQTDTMAELEELTGKSIRLQGENQYTQEQFDVVLQ